MSSIILHEIHQLKTLPPFFDDVVALRKPFEVRKNDRGFNAGHILVLREWDGKRYTGRHVCKRVTYLLTGGAFGVQEGYCVMGIGYTEEIFDGDYGEYSQSDAKVES